MNVIVLQLSKSKGKNFIGVQVRSDSCSKMIHEYCMKNGCRCSGSKELLLCSTFFLFLDLFVILSLRSKIYNIYQPLKPSW